MTTDLWTPPSGPTAPDIGAQIRAAAAAQAKATLASAAEWLEGVRRVLAPLALIAYVGVRLGYDGFYGRLGLSAREVGVGYADMVSRAAVGLAVFVVGYAVTGILAGLVGASLIPLDGDDPERPRGLRHLTLGGLTLMAAGGVVCALESFVEHAPPTLGVLMATMGAATALPGWPLRFSGLRGRLLHPVVRLLVLVLVVLSTLMLVEFGGEERASKVIEGTPLRATPLTAIIEMRAEPVCVEWIGADRPPSVPLPAPFLYLGRDQGEVVLYRGLTQRDSTPGSPPVGAVRLPLPKVALSADNGRGCPPR